MAYRMTARRRSALRKAQLASARKRKLRRKRVAYAAGISVGTAVLGTALYGRKLISSGPRGHQKYAPPMATRQLNRGRSRGNPLGTRKKWDKRKKRWVSVPPGGTFRASADRFGTASYAQKVRPAYDAKRRASYTPRSRASTKATRRRKR